MSLIEASPEALVRMVHPVIWTWKAVLNVTWMGKLSSDRITYEYARDIRGLGTLP